MLYQRLITYQRLKDEKSILFNSFFVTVHAVAEKILIMRSPLLFWRQSR